MVYFTEISSHPDQGVTVTLRPAIPISLRETPNAVKLRFLSHVESGGGVTCNEISDMRKNSRGEQG